MLRRIVEYDIWYQALRLYVFCGVMAAFALYYALVAMPERVLVKMGLIKEAE